MPDHHERTRALARRGPAAAWGSRVEHKAAAAAVGSLALMLAASRYHRQERTCFLVFLPYLVVLAWPAKLVFGPTTNGGRGLPRLGILYIY
jgi:hypothetical protein